MARPSLIRRGSVVLIRYPFTDLTATKVRPAVIVTANSLIPRLEDVLCLFVSSSIPNELLPTDLVIEPENPAFPPSGLRLRSVFRTHKLALLHRDLVLRVLGELSSAVMEQLNRRLQVALGLVETSEQ